MKSSNQVLQHTFGLLWLDDYDSLIMQGFRVELLHQFGGFGGWIGYGFLVVDENGVNSIWSSWTLFSSPPSYRNGPSSLAPPNPCEYLTSNLSWLILKYHLLYILDDNINKVISFYKYNAHFTI